MSDFDRPGLMIDEQPKRRGAAARFGDLGERLSRTFGGFDRTRAELPGWEPGDELTYPMAAETVSFPPPIQRFPVVREGYDPAAVDQQLDDLERELAALRGRRPVASAVAAEIDRIGEQTAAILQTAYEQAGDITRSARAQADKCLADAASNAVAMTEDANRRLRELDAETDVIWHERSRLIDDARNVATALFSLAEDAVERFPADPQKVTREPSETPAPEASAPSAFAAPDASAPSPFAAPDPGDQVPPRDEI